MLIVLGLYFWLVFGHLSRRFERQADIFGSQIVSCDGGGIVRPTSTRTATRGRQRPGAASCPLCRVGLRTFSEALAIVAAM